MNERMKGGLQGKEISFPACLVDYQGNYGQNERDAPANLFYDKGWLRLSEFFEQIVQQQSLGSLESKTSATEEAGARSGQQNMPYTW